MALIHKKTGRGSIRTRLATNYLLQICLFAEKLPDKSDNYHQDPATGATAEHLADNCADTTIANGSKNAEVSLTLEKTEVLLR